jgi:hypothetical protein
VYAALQVQATPAAIALVHFGGSGSGIQWVG